VECGYDEIKSVRISDVKSVYPNYIVSSKNRVLSITWL